MKQFDVLKFIADNAGLNLADALVKAYEQGQNDYKEKIDQVTKQLESNLIGVNITLEVLAKGDALIPKMEGAKDTLEDCLSYIHKYCDKGE
jgi:hypothetical protein